MGIVDDYSSAKNFAAFLDLSALDWVDTNECLPWWLSWWAILIWCVILVVFCAGMCTVSIMCCRRKRCCCFANRGNEDEYKDLSGDATASASGGGAGLYDSATAPELDGKKV